jgi:hypothetical protein
MKGRQMEAQWSTAQARRALVGVGAYLLLNVLVVLASAFGRIPHTWGRPFDIMKLFFVASVVLGTIGAILFAKHCLRVWSFVAFEAMITCSIIFNLVMFRLASLTI